MDHHVFTEADRAQLAANGVCAEDVRRQLARFRTGFPYITLRQPCTVGHGICVIPPTQHAALTEAFDMAADAGRVMKFIPASGAASRMFRALLAMQTRDIVLDADSHASATESRDPDRQVLQQFRDQLPQFAFVDALAAVLAPRGDDVSALCAAGTMRPVLEALLGPSGLRYADLPKAILLFHRYADHCRTPLEEHLVEAVNLLVDHDGIARLHVTVSVAHMEAVQRHIASVRGRYERGGVQFAISLSTQKPSTDTIAVDLENRPMRLEDGSLLFRPAGHGALLENLNEMHGDIVCIKNIDNVVPDHLKDDTYLYTKVLGGYLLTLQRTLFTFLKQLATRHVAPEQIDAMLLFARTQLGLTFPPDIQRRPLQEQIAALCGQFNRPLRVCGVVPNTGEPGGGPFWVEGADGTVSLQIVETAQIDPEVPEQQAILAASTHFNPVHMVCGVRDCRGQSFDLPRFVDPETGFISIKSHAGHALKAMEVPGLWNGSMAYWNTVFVEIPLSTFTPVKTVLDLLRSEHQPRE